ncbi:exonuclease SbcCD subunit D [Candidatus Gracilibacteria bacterium]|nr:exonuclease SbcCD subunit D [Candidatus Gracilibacteria bacterium]
MKLMHISDLHIGKRVNEFSMLEDQEYILNGIIKIAKDENISGIIIAGDVYDKTVPPIEAVDLADEFLTKLVEENISIYMISGNHDSPERLNFGSRIMEKNNLFICGEYDGDLRKIVIEDEYGKLNIYFLPYIKPSIVNNKLGLETKTYDESVKEALKVIDIDVESRNILIAHQFVTFGSTVPELSDSETKSLGGIDNVDASIFDKFDYVALGHIHKPQKIGREVIRYSGSPLKYSFSECNHKKSVCIVDFKEKNNCEIKLVPLIPKRDMKHLKTSMEDLKSGNILSSIPSDTYMHITLTDDEEVIDAISKVREIFKNVMVLDFDNKRNGENLSDTTITSEDLKQKTPKELFVDFFSSQNNVELTESQNEIISNIVNEVLEVK